MVKLKRRDRNASAPRKSGAKEKSCQAVAAFGFGAASSALK
jgi:hypothetical protein